MVLICVPLLWMRLTYIYWPFFFLLFAFGLWPFSCYVLEIPCKFKEIFCHVSQFVVCFLTFSSFYIYWILYLVKLSPFQVHISFLPMFSSSAFMAFPSHFSLPSPPPFFSPSFSTFFPSRLLWFKSFIYLEFILIKDPASQELSYFPLIWIIK